MSECKTCGGRGWVTGWCENIPTGPEDCPVCQANPGEAMTTKPTSETGYETEELMPIGPLVARLVGIKGGKK